MKLIMFIDLMKMLKKIFFFWIGMLLMMKIMKKRMEGDGRRRKKMNNTNPNVFLIFLTEGTKIGHGDKDKVLKRSFF